MNQLPTTRYEWKDVPWKKIQRVVFKLQKRIYQASQRGDVRQVHKLQRLLIKSRSAKLLAVRQVTQDNRGKKTAGIDGISSLKPAERIDLVEKLELPNKFNPTRRVWIPKPGKTEKRPLGIPTIEDRAYQALVKLAMEPEWEAKFESNSYGFRPGRSCHDAIEAIYISLHLKNAFVLDADIKGCFDNIDHSALLTKINTYPRLRRILKGWLKAGYVDNGVRYNILNGTPQGGVISPLLANIALHGLETHLKEQLISDMNEWSYKEKGKRRGGRNMSTLSVIRYADDFVIIHEDLSILLKAKSIAEEWLSGIGLELKPSKTRICHTLNRHDNEKPGFNFLGFNIRQYKDGSCKQGFKTLTKPCDESVKEHLENIKYTLRTLRGSPQEGVISKLNPIIKGWTRYFSTGVSRKTFEKISDLTHHKLWRWSKFRHAHKGEQWIKRKYFRPHGNDNWRFKTEGGIFLIRHSDQKIQRHTKVKGNKSPYDGDYIYWSTRMGKHPLIQPRMAELLKTQKGKCHGCGYYFQPNDILETHHIDGNHDNNKRMNLALLHGHCHDNIHGKGALDKRQSIEEPYEPKGTCTVLKSSKNGDILIQIN